MRWLVYAALFALAFSDGCVYPGQTPPETCDAPTTAKNSVVEDVPGRGQWPNRDGYCGSNSIQMIALTYGAWISQDLVRKSVGNNEILHTNIQQAITTLLFTLDSWNYTAYPIPQYKTYLTWLKTHLLQRQPVIWFIYCQGDSHGPHGGDGYYDHIEPVFGVWTNSTLNDTDWYPDDVLVHNSDWDQNHYYRPFDTLWDTAAMDGNCADAPSGSGHNEMYPCIPSDNYDYGYSMMGFVDPAGKAVQAQLYVSDWEEPDLDDHKPAENMTGKLVIRGIQKGTEYFIYRWDDVNECPGCLGGSYTPSIPSNSDYANSDWDYKYSFSAPDTTYTFQDPHTFLSSGATYYRVVPPA